MISKILILKNFIWILKKYYTIQYSFFLVRLGSDPVASAGFVVESTASPSASPPASTASADSVLCVSPVHSSVVPINPV
jgi:hypothetical protein